MDGELWNYIIRATAYTYRRIGITDMRVKRSIDVRLSR